MADRLPLVSIITPTYNRADYLEETIQSVLRQDYSNLEYIVIDDGSTDHTADVLKKYVDRLTAHFQANLGEARTVNRGLAMAKGDFIGVVNSDDPILPGLVKAAVSCLQSDPKLLVAYPDWVMVDAQGRPLQTINVYDFDYLNMLRWHHCVPGPGAIFRREAIELERGRDEQYRYVGDFDFWLRVGLHGPFARIPQVLATFRHHATSASISSRGLLMAQEHIRLLDNLYRRQDLPPGARTVRREAYSAAHYIAAIQCLPKQRRHAAMYFMRSYLYHRGSRPNGLPRASTTNLIKLLMAEQLRLRLRRAYCASVGRFRGAALGK
jgi:glycosyltransferase involved in cell wall biosynthesis